MSCDHIHRTLRRRPNPKDSRAPRRDLCPPRIVYNPRTDPQTHRRRLQRLQFLFTLHLQCYFSLTVPFPAAE